MAAGAFGFLIFSHAFDGPQRKRNIKGRYLCALFFTFRWKDFGLEWRFYERIFCQVFVVVSRDEFSFFKFRRPPLNLKIFISGDAFDDSTFFYQQLKFTWLVRLGIAVEFGGEVNAPSWDPIPLYDTFNVIAVFAAC